MKVLLVGDIHAQFDVLVNAIKYVQERVDTEIDKIVQVGDFGYYPNHTYKPGQSYYLEVGRRVNGLYTAPLEENLAPEMWCIRGNHEDHQEWHKIRWNVSEDGINSKMPTTGGRRGFLGAWKAVPDGYLDEDGVLYVGGAWSIDGAYRAQVGKELKEHGIDRLLQFDPWQPELEQVSSIEFEEIRDFVADHKKDIRLVVSHDCDTQTLLTLISRKNAFINRTNKLLEFIVYEVGKVNKDLKQVCGHHHQRRDFGYVSNGRHELKSVVLDLLPNISSIFFSMKSMDAYDRACLRLDDARIEEMEEDTKRCLSANMVWYDTETAQFEFLEFPEE